MLMEELPIRFYIVMPVYNAEAYIEQSINSVLEQTYDRYTLVMVDDGSSDNSGCICDRFVAADSRLTVVHQQNAGQIAAREAGIKKVKMLATSNDSNGSEQAFVVFLDSDDWLVPDALETIASRLNQTNCDCLIYGFHRVLNNKIVFSTHAENSEEVLNYIEACRKICLNREYNSLCRKAFRLKLLSDSDYSEYYHIRFGEDLLQTLDALRRVRSVVFVTDHLYNYRINSKSVTESIDYTKFDFDYTVARKQVAFLRENEVHTHESWEKQWKALAEYVYVDVMKLLFSSHKWLQKREWLRRIRGASYIRDELLVNVPYNMLPSNQRIVLRFFRWRCYSVLWLYYLLTKLLKV